MALTSATYVYSGTLTLISLANEILVTIPRLICFTSHYVLLADYYCKPGHTFGSASVANVSTAAWC